MNHEDMLKIFGLLSLFLCISRLIVMEVVEIVFDLRDQIRKRW